MGHNRKSCGIRKVWFVSRVWALQRDDEALWRVKFGAQPNPTAR